MMCVYDYQGQTDNNFRTYFTVQGTQNLYGGTAPCTDTTTRPEINGITCTLSGSSPTPTPTPTPSPTPTGDTTPPTTSITSPSAGSTVSNTTTISATASDNVGVSQIEFYIDGVLRGTDTTSPYSYSWDTTNGGTHACIGAHTHTLQTRAYDAANNQGSSASVTVNMNNPSYCAPPTSSPTPSRTPTSSPTTAATPVPGSLLSHWTFDEGAGATANDSAGTNHATLTNNPTWTPAGRVNGAISFDGIDDYLNAGTMNISGSAMTITAWINAQDLANCASRDCRIISKAAGTADQDHWWMISTIASGSDTRLHFRLKANTTTHTLIANTGNT